MATRDYLLAYISRYLVSIELSKELKAIDAGWEPVIIHEAQKKKREREERVAQVRRELRAELRAIDAEWRLVIARESLRKELDAIDAECRHTIKLRRSSKL